MITADILGERARLTPAKTALVFVPTGERLTYHQLNERAIRCARLLADRCGLKKGDRVGILAHNRVEFVEAIFAAAKTGIILVPLNTRNTAHELEYIVRDSQMKALFCESEFADIVANLRGTTMEHFIALDTPASGDIAYAAARDSYDAAGWRNAEIDPEDLLCLLYTSGTTGKPKGVMTPHRMVAWNAYNTVMSWQLQESDVSPIFTPMYHAGGLGVFLTPLFAIGGTIVLHRAFDAAEVWHTIEREKCTVVLGVPTIWKLLADAPEFQTTDMSSLRWLCSGGAPLPLHIIETYQSRGLNFKQGYGLTEVGVNCFSMTVEESVRKAGSIGKPMLFTEAKLIGADDREVAPGETGELLLRGPHVCRGYWNNAAATAAALDNQGWFHTGDLARRDEEGFFYIAGRAKDMFISGGVNVYPAEIEAELLQHPAVQDAAVIGVEHETWGEVGVAFIVLREQQHADDTQLSEFLTQRLAKYKVPREFVFTAALPRSAYGKVLKPELAKRYVETRAKAAQPSR